jgi:3-mercaptopyruvate sulfurtransferase SseA
MRRVLLQAMAMLGIAITAAAISNMIRPTLRWRGDDLDLMRHKVPRIPLAEAARAQASAATLFLDTRAAADFGRAHVPGAVAFGGADLQVPYDELRDFLAPEMTLIVYGDDVLAAVRAVEFLNARGHTAHVLEGGWSAWTLGRHPIESMEAP